MEMLIVLVLAVAAWFVLHAASGGSAASPPPDDPSLSSQPSDYDLGSISSAVAWVESRGRQYNASGGVLTSKAGALGIMQLMPGTAAQYRADPNDPDQNVRAGTSYLSDLYAKYGNWADALAAYVWGPAKVDSALASGSAYPGQVQQYIQDVEAQAG